MSENNLYFPFYAHPMNRKRSVQIIKEAKAEIKKMESGRPSTPFSCRNVKPGLKKDFMDSSRPSSCASIKSLKYELEENHDLCIRKLSPARAQKPKERVIKLQPIVTKPLLMDRKYSGINMRSQKEVEFIGLPPLPCDEQTNAVKKSLEIVGDSVRDECGLTDINRLDSELTPIKGNFSLSSEEIGVSTEIESLNSLSIRCDVNAQEIDEQLAPKNEQQDVENELSIELSSFFPLLERNIRLGSKKSENDASCTVKNIYDLLKEKSAFLLIHDNRIPLLKLLFRLLDTNFPTLSLNIVKLLLKMKIKDKNLSSVFRLLLKLIKDEVNFREYQLVESILQTMNEISVLSNMETLIYGIMILKRLICTHQLERAELGRCLDILMHHLCELNFLLSSDENCNKKHYELFFLCITTLRHLVEDGTVWNSLIKVDNLSEILKGLICSSQNADIFQTVLRLISKIVDETDGCVALSKCPEDHLLEFLSILETYRYNIDLTLQTAFIIGNLVVANEKTALAFVTSPNFIATTVVLGDYVSEHIQFKESVSSCFKSESFISCGDRNWHHDIFEVIRKILCIWANICFHQEAGHCLAKQDIIVSDLLSAVVAYAGKGAIFDASIALQSFLGVITNISYYLGPVSEICIKTAECVIPLLDDCYSFEIRLEAAEIIQNLTKSVDVRLYIQEHSLMTAFMKLINEDDKTFCTRAYGIIMNLLIDESFHHIFYKEQGITRVLHKLHLCTDRDWKTSALLCQVLWNYCRCQNCNLMSEMETKHIVKYLLYTLRDKEKNKPQNENDSSHQDWKTNFYPVANELLNLMQTKNSTNT